MPLLPRLARASRRNRLHISRLSACSSVREYANKVAKLSIPKEPVRTRFAPSPTGYLHLGSLRTALFNYLLARKTGGQFLLRVEDTDESRTVSDAEHRLYEDLRWAGLDWDEGPDIGGDFGPYKQSQRFNIYKAHANKLIESGRGYRCFCSAERLDALARRRRELGLPTDYDRSCAGLSREESEERASKGQAHVVRLKVPDVWPQLEDLVYGTVGRSAYGRPSVLVKHGEITYEDPILLKSDGQPTYHLANVVDDHLMNISHVIRATEWISSTPKHLALYDAFGWTPPQYAHVSLLVDTTGNKLSKRNHAVNVNAYRDIGVLPTALANFVALLGWSHSERSDVMNLEQMIENFSFKFTKGNATVTFEKLWYLQKHHASRAIESESAVFEDMVTRVVDKVASVQTQLDGDTILPIASELGPSLRVYVKDILRADHRSYSSAEEFVQRNKYFFRRPSHSTEDSISTTTSNRDEQAPPAEIILEEKEAITGLYSAFSSVKPDEWNLDNISDTIAKAANALSQPSTGTMGNLKEYDSKRLLKLAHHSLRNALLAGCQGPKMAASITILGREETLNRLKSYLANK